MSRVLVIEDEEPMSRTLDISLRARGYQVEVAATGEDALDLARRTQPDLVILDLGLPGMDGIEVAQALRVRSEVPIIVLSARGAESVKVAALDAGADDYVTKPFSIEELLARIRAVSRRTFPTEPPPSVHIGEWLVDLGDRVVSDRSDPTRTVHLTRTEWQLIELFARNPGKLISQRQLLQEVWGPTYLDQTQYLRQYLTQLRRKLEQDPARPRHLLTEPGMGYRFQP